jgi:hypothetical protein
MAFERSLRNPSIHPSSSSSARNLERLRTRSHHQRSR